MIKNFEDRQVGNEDVGVFKVGPIGYGLMRLSIGSSYPPEERAIQAILKAVESGCNFLNTGEFYGSPKDDRLNANLQLLDKFFKIYPEWEVDGKLFISVKGGMPFEGDHMQDPDGSEEFLRKNVDNINKKLGGRRKMDLFQMARVDKKIPIEEVIKTLKKFIDEGKFKHIGLSEVSAQTIRRAHAVHPISAVEVEYSPWSLHIETNGVLTTCEELGIPVIGYSPLGWGMLTGKFKSIEDIPEDDFRRSFSRFSPENFNHNLKLTEQIKEFAKSKDCTPVQITLSWILSQSKIIIPIPGSTRLEGIEECVGSLKVKLNEDELKKLREIINKAQIRGGRYSDEVQGLLDV